MNAWLAVTDRDRFDFLASQSHVDEVNFWQPNPWGGRVLTLTGDSQAGLWLTLGQQVSDNGHRRSYVSHNCREDR